MKTLRLCVSASLLLLVFSLSSCVTTYTTGDYTEGLRSGQLTNMTTTHNFERVIVRNPDGSSFEMVGGESDWGDVQKAGVRGAVLESALGAATKILVP